MRTDSVGRCSRCGYEGPGPRHDCKPSGRDVGWAIADGVTKPIREVIAERKAQAAKIDRATREAAYRERCRLQAMLIQCLCAFPLVLTEETESKHAPWCPAEGQLQSFKRIDASDT